MILAMGFGFVLTYLLGSLNFAVIVSRLLYHDDVRNYGSGNAGMTNMLRTYGKKAAFLTGLGDFFKGTLSVVLARGHHWRSGAAAAILERSGRSLYRFAGNRSPF